MKPVEIRQVGVGARVSDWIEVPSVVHRDDPHFVRQLDLHERLRISRWYNPFFRHGTAALFVAFRDGKPVGRISAQINRQFHERHDPTCGHFGFFDCIDDTSVAIALFDAARRWLSAQGSKTMLGPFSFSINQESGLLIEGFDEPAAILMNQALPFSGGLVEAAGLVKAMDTFAFRARRPFDMARIGVIARSAQQRETLKVRPVELKSLERDVRLLVEIFNDAWSDNWGFVPFTEFEIPPLVRELKMVLMEGCLNFIEKDGYPVAFILNVPDINGLIGSFDGKLFPFNFIKLLSALRANRFRNGRVAMLGVRQAFQRTQISPAILALLSEEIARLGRTLNFDWLELSWVLETNRPMIALATIIAGAPIKRYRIYSGDVNP